MKELHKSEMLAYFEEINSMLAARHKYGDILIAGGAALTLVYGARSSTYDIDAIFKPSEEMRDIIKLIAGRHNLGDDWLNDGVKGFFTPQMQDGQEIFQKYSNLTVSSLNAECLLAMKLTSARTLTKDMSDSIFLMRKLNIQTEDELFAIIEKYIDENRRTPAARFFTLEAFEKYRSVKSQVMEQTKSQVSEQSGKTSVLEAIRRDRERVRQPRPKRPSMGKDSFER